MRHASKGFTLLELSIALSLVGLVMVGAILLLDEINDGAGRIARAATQSTRKANGERQLSQLISNAEVTSDTSKNFHGDEFGVAWTTRCVVPAGWSEPCQARVVVDRREDSSALVAELSTGESYVLRAWGGPVELRYLNPRIESDTFWLRRWASNVALPRAVGIVTDHDTILLPVGSNRD
ncbi:MAG: prepilin-type N-terminal cleavage/methylation domain-containing protein [Gemmatimonadaceae bacterium]